MSHFDLFNSVKDIDEVAIEMVRVMQPERFNRLVNDELLIQRYVVHLAPLVVESMKHVGWMKKQLLQKIEELDERVKMAEKEAASTLMIEIDAANEPGNEHTPLPEGFV